MKLYLLQPTGPLFATGGAMDGLLPRSDSISAALVSLWPHVQPQADMDQVAAAPPFRVSSLLPCIFGNDGTPEILYPVPQGLAGMLAAAQPARRKKLKRLTYASKATLRQMLEAGKAPTDEEMDSEGRLALSPKLMPPGGFARASLRPRLQVDRLTMGPAEGLLFDERVWFLADNCGFALIADVEPAARIPFESTLTLLGETGLGRYRSAGKGGFRVRQVEPWNPPFPQRGDSPSAWVLLSLWHPTQKEVEAGGLAGAYGLVQRGGWVTANGGTGLRRGSVRMLEEGSWTPVKPEGDVVQTLQPMPEQGLPHPVLRDGRALAMPVPILRLKEAQDDA